MRILIKGGRILDPGNIDTVADILIDKGHVAEISSGIDNSSPDRTPDRTIDATGCIVTPGLIDMHVHLREPGHEYKESIETGIQAAAAGGFTAVCCMPNTFPVNDNAQITRFIAEKAASFRSVRVYPIGAVSIGLSGEQLAEFGEMKDAGAVGVSDDGNPVINSQLMRRALEYGSGIGLPVISHCEDPHLGRGVMNEGELSTRLGLPAIPNAAESVMVMRDLALCELTGSRVHIAHVSTRQSVEAIRSAKARGTRVTCETAPHYFTLTEAAIRDYDTHAKMNPPLRSEADRQAILDGLADGTIDAIATDHAPHARVEKEVEFDAAANGIIGLETSLPLGLALVARGILSIHQLIEKMSSNPARIIGCPSGINVGAPADLTIIDPSRVYIYRTDEGRSKSINSPFDRWEMTGRAVFTIAGGKLVYEAK